MFVSCFVGQRVNYQLEYHQQSSLAQHIWGVRYQDEVLDVPAKQQHIRRVRKCLAARFTLQRFDAKVSHAASQSL